MLHRRSTAFAAGALLLAAPLLSSCGFDAQTNNINTISAGVNDRDGEVDVLGAVVIAAQPDAGVFAATLVNNSTEDADSLTSLAGGGAGDIAPIGGVVDPYDVPVAGKVNMFDDDGIDVRGDFVQGDFVDVVLTFSSGQTSTLSVPVVVPCYQYADKVEQPDVADPSADPSDLPTAESDSATGSGDSEATDPSSCDPIDPEVYGDRSDSANGLPAGEGDE